MRMKRLGLAATPVLLAALAALAAPPAAAQTAAGAAQAAAPNGVGSAFELTFWQSVTGSEDPASYEAYLARYPDGTFSGLARARIAAIQRAAAVQPAAAPAPEPIAAPAPISVPAVLTLPQSAAPLAPIPAAVASAPSAAPTSAPANLQQPALAEAAPSPLARLLAQLRSSGDPAAQGTAVAPAPDAAPLVTPVQPVQPLAATAPGLSQPAQIQPAYAPAPVANSAANPGANYASARPLLLPVPDVALPGSFCSNDARNLFHNNTYRPAVEVATRNNEAAIAYLRQLQQTYDRGQLGRDTAVLNAIAAEARAYQAEAARAYTVQAALVRQFDALMTVPLRPCAAPMAQ
ncbi:hypothetical protein [Novosphingobium sp. PASSN1]|uniref:hypothetical protein n=1 Tax=Novosphingobium sp. PASSN1 TaxID=2015561 RepID=UPI0025D23946|nr:hypothetical protein [Novosphingobium sp. PASSN1]